MKLNKLLLIVIFCLKLFAEDEINVNFKDLKITDLIKITSKIVNKNILITQEIEGTIDFIPNKKVTKTELLKLLELALQEKGYSLVDEYNILRVIKTTEIKKDSLTIKLKNIKSNIAKKSLDEISKTIPEQEKQNISIIENFIDNSITLIGKKSQIEYLSNYIKSLDENFVPIKKDVKVINIKNIDALNIVKILEDVITKNQNLDLLNKPLISLDNESNSIIVMGSSEELSYIERLVKELDVEKNQVYVQAKIIEVNDELVNQIGISYGIFAGNANNNGLTTFSTSLNKGAIPTFSVDGLVIPEISSGLALGATLNLLKQNGALDIVSEPSILAINNKESSIYVGETISIKTSSSVTDGGTTRENFQREDVGLTLKVKPRISNETKVILEINTTLEGIKTTQTISGNADTSKKEVKTTAILNNGESVIIGGLIENKSETTNQKVPILGDVPLFGDLFKNDITSNRKNNLVVIVTPYLVPKTKDITFIRNKLSELKNLEDKYLEDSLLKLKENSLKKKIQDKSREEKSKELDNKIKSIETSSSS